MNKINRVVSKTIAALVAVVGILNVIDSIYAGVLTSAATQDLTMSATITDSATIELSGSNLALNPTPSSSGTWASTAEGGSPFTVTIYTNSSTGFNLGMTTSETSLKSGDDSISTLVSATPQASFPLDRWGYSVGNSDYQPVASSNNIGTYTRPSSNAQNGTSVQINFGVKLSLATPPGTYTGTLNFTATAVTP